MKKSARILGLLLCLALCLSLALPALATGESNSKGVVFNVSLDKPTIEKSSIDQTVAMTISMTSAQDMSSLEFDITKPSWMTTSDAAISMPFKESGDLAGYTAGDTENAPHYAWVLGSMDVDCISIPATIGTITFTIPANTAAGTYTVGIANVQADNDGDTWEENAFATATLTITDNSTVEGYAAHVSSTATTVSVGDAVAVSINATKAGETKYAAAEMTLSYDKDKLAFESVTGIANKNVKNDATTGIITFEDYGTDKNLGNGIYTVNFTAKTKGEAAVTLTSAKLSAKANAAEKDLAVATIAELSKTVTFTLTQDYTVTINADPADCATGNAGVASGEAYTLTVKNLELYNYTVSATMGGKSATVKHTAGEATYTVDNVSGNLVFTVTRTARQFTINFSKASGSPAGWTLDQLSDTVTYGTDYSFTIPTLTDYNVCIDSIKIGETDITGWAAEDTQITIPGDKLTGNIAVVFAASKGAVNVSVKGAAAGDVGTYKMTAEALTDYVLPLANRDTLYKYTVTAKMNGTDVTVTEDQGNYKVTATAVKKGNLIFTVEKELDIKVCLTDDQGTPYLTLDNTKMWLLKVPMTEELSGRNLTYNGNDMFFVAGYGEEGKTAGCYCYLVISETMPDTNDLTKFGVNSSAEAAKISGFDVNMTENLDANDAQLIYNMYNTEYSAFDTDVTVQKFLLADINSDGKVDTADVAAVISEILK